MARRDNTQSVDVGLVIALARRIARQFIGVTISSFGTATVTGGNYIIPVTLSNNDVINLTIPIADAFSTAYILASGNTQITDDGNYRLRIDGDLLDFDRREGTDWNTVATLGGSVTSDSFIIEQLGKLQFKDSSDILHNLIKGSVDGTGAVISNSDGRIALINNGELLDVHPLQATDEFTLNNDGASSVNGDTFEYSYTITQSSAIHNIKFYLANVPIDTIGRICIHSDGNLLDENVNENEFRLSQGLALVNGENNLILETETPLRMEEEIFVRFFTSNAVDVLGSDVDFPQDSLGSRFFPQSIIGRTALEESNITTESNIVTQLAPKLTEGQNITITSTSDSIEISASGTGEVNVQSDWAETDTSSDTYIANKPTIPAPITARTDEEIRAVMGMTLVEGNDITITVDNNANTIMIARTGTSTPTNPTHPLYIDATTDTNADSVDIDNAFSSNTLVGTFTIPTFTGNQYVQFLQPETHSQYTSITIGGLNQIGAFTINDNARTINGQSYRQYVSNNQLIGSVVSGDTVVLGGGN